MGHWWMGGLPYLGNPQFERNLGLCSLAFGSFLSSRVLGSSYLVEQALLKADKVKHLPSYTKSCHNTALLSSAFSSECPLQQQQNII